MVDDAPDTFTCCICRKEYLYGWSEEEALAELADNFGFSPTKEDCNLICDDCYKAHFPELVQS